MTRARLVTFPVADGAFYVYAVECYDYSVDTPTQLEARIRRRYPKAQVQPGRTDATGLIRWFNYRDDEVGAVPF